MVQMYVHESIHVYMYMCLFLFVYGGILACVCAFTVGMKKSSHLPSVQRDG